MSGLDEARGNLKRLAAVANLVRCSLDVSCCVSLLRPEPKKVEMEARGPEWVGLTYTAAGSFQLWNYCVVVGP